MSTQLATFALVGLKCGALAVLVLFHVPSFLHIWSFICSKFLLWMLCSGLGGADLMSLPALSEWLHVAMTELCFGELVNPCPRDTSPLTRSDQLVREQPPLCPCLNSNVS